MAPNEEIGRKDHIARGSSASDVACQTPRQKTAEQIAVFWTLHKMP
jgi:hypothetical protein